MPECSRTADLSTVNLFFQTEIGDSGAPMQQLFTNAIRIPAEWLRTARDNTRAATESPTLPVWIAVAGVLIDFGLMHLSYRHTEMTWSVRWVISATLMFLVRLAAVSAILYCTCRFFRVPATSFGIRPQTMLADFRWSFRIWFLFLLVAGAVVAAGVAAAVVLGIHLPAPPQFVADLLSGQWRVGRFAVFAILGTLGNVLVVVTEELIYRSLVLPPLMRRLGLWPAIVISAIIFGLAHVVPFGIVRIPAPQIIGGTLMAFGFAVRWSVVPAMVIHLFGNLFAGIVVFGYVQLFHAYPKLFVGA
jgi:membrane protease YdiL (CAAX protease family)